MLRSELKRAFLGKSFWVALVIGCAICIAHVFQFVIPDLYESQMFPPPFPPSAYTRWIGAWSYPVHPAIFFFICPFLATLPHGWSLYSDRKSGYYTQISTRTTWPKYTASKIVATFLSGAAVCVLPLVVNFLGTSCVLPLIQPNPIGLGQFMIHPGEFAATLFFENAALYLLLYLGITAVAMGVVACLALPLGCFLPNKALAMLAPFIICTVLAQLTQKSNSYSFAPTSFIRPGQDYGSMQPELACLFVMCCVALITITTLKIFRNDYLN